MLQHLAGMDDQVDDSCKRTVEYLRHSLIIIYTACVQWQGSFIWEKSACLMEVSVAYGEPGTHCLLMLSSPRISVNLEISSSPAQELGTRLTATQ